MSVGATGDRTPEDLYWGAFYLSRILTSNLRCLVAELADLEIGPLRIRRGEDLEVYGRGRLRGEAVRVGFLLRGPKTAPAEALSVFVETGKGAARSIAARRVPSGADEEETGDLLQGLLHRRQR